MACYWNFLLVMGVPIKEELSQKNLEINEKYEILTLQLKKQINTKKFLIKNLQKELTEFENELKIGKK